MNLTPDRSRDHAPSTVLGLLRFEQTTPVWSVAEPRCRDGSTCQSRAHHASHSLGAPEPKKEMTGLWCMNVARLLTADAPRPRCTEPSHNHRGITGNAGFHGCFTAPLLAEGVQLLLPMAQGSAVSDVERFGHAIHQQRLRLGLISVSDADSPARVSLNSKETGQRAAPWSLCGLVIRLPAPPLLSANVSVSTWDGRGPETYPAEVCSQKPFQMRGLQMWPRCIQTFSDTAWSVGYIPAPEALDPLHTTTTTTSTMLTTSSPLQTGEQTTLGWSATPAYTCHKT
ncbi:unnamed protein product [Pleuronectes platessa]|uniref:Uncharacterized protein n=1 Tax=Pleuronectes platessa TaxID=8262 RepID=A0A9N7TUX7_PLEPL|nr:unnamed protein product [Pleuronectes platessa]